MIRLYWRPPCAAGVESSDLPLAAISPLLVRPRGPEREGERR